MYHGPREALPGYLSSLGFRPPAAAAPTAAGAAGGPPGRTPVMSGAPGVTPHLGGIPVTREVSDGADAMAAAAGGGSGGDGAKSDMADWCVTLHSGTFPLWGR